MCINNHGRSEDDEDELFSVLSSDRTRGSGHKLKCKEFYLNTKNI